eukprot:TRINITY_DN936_c0_g1_i10.p2 TRINITY_DN936_c0_g1~~TRINITY_DN936_c0_g1_i10.p2  ORF type:complete len:177 (+),score=36.06 TRINITY_DN936_c0_g1_i10:192-722(+)
MRTSLSAALLLLTTLAASGLVEVRYDKCDRNWKLYTNPEVCGKPNPPVAEDMFANMATLVADYCATHDLTCFRKKPCTPDVILQNALKDNVGFTDIESIKLTEMEEARREVIVNALNSGKSVIAYDDAHEAYLFHTTYGDNAVGITTRGQSVFKVFNKLLYASIITTSKAQNASLF